MFLVQARAHNLLSSRFIVYDMNAGQLVAMLGNAADIVRCGCNISNGMKIGISNRNLGMVTQISMHTLVCKVSTDRWHRVSLEA
jgi:hypothetical protein